MEVSREIPLINSYYKLRKLGQSTSGDIFLVEEGQGGPQWTVKVVSKKLLAKNQGSKELLKTGVECMKRLNEPHIVKLKDFLEDNDNFYIVLEYCDIGDIISLQAKQANRVFKLNSASEYLSHVLLSLEALHSRGYMHGEINLQNVLAKNEDSRQVLKIRFDGFTKLTLKLKAQTSVNIQYFKAPQIFMSDLKSQSSALSLGYEIDIWSFGVLFFFMLNMEFPFKLNPHLDWSRWYQELCRQAQNFSYRKAVASTTKNITKNCTDDVENLFRRVFEIDPRKRITAVQLRKHPLFAPYFRTPAYLIERIIYHPIKKRLSPTIQTGRVAKGKKDMLQLQLEEISFLTNLVEELQFVEEEIDTILIIMLSYHLLKFSIALLHNLHKKALKENYSVLDSRIKGEFSAILGCAKQRLSEIQSQCQQNCNQIGKINKHFIAGFNESISDSDELGKHFFCSYRKSTAIVYTSLKQRLKSIRTPRMCYLVCSICIAHNFPKLYGNEELKKKVFSAFLNEILDDIFEERISYKKVVNYLHKCDSQGLLRFAKKVIDDII